MKRTRPWRRRAALLAGTPLLGTAAGTAPGGAAPVVQVWETTSDKSKLLERQEDEEFGPAGARRPSSTWTRTRPTRRQR